MFFGISGFIKIIFRSTNVLYLDIIYEITFYIDITQCFIYLHLNDSKFVCGRWLPNSGIVNGFIRKQKLQVQYSETNFKCTCST